MVFTLMVIAYVVYLSTVALALLGLRHEGRVQLMPDSLMRFCVYCILFIPMGMIVLVQSAEVHQMNPMRYWIYEGYRRVCGWGRQLYSSCQSYLDRVNRGAETMPLVYTEPGKPDEYHPVQRENV